MTDATSRLLDDLSDDLSDALSKSDPHRKTPSVTCTIEKVLDEEDIAEYLQASGSMQTVQEKDVQVLRSRHHSVARLLAAGVPEGIVADITGFTGSHIKTLKNSPSVQQLIEFYRAPGDNTAKTIGENLRLVADMSIERLKDAVVANELDPNVLLALAKLGLDRSGHGPQSTVHNINENRVIDVAELARLNLEARERNMDLLVPVQEVRKALPNGNSSLED
jgi:hypothetical protein